MITLAASESIAALRTWITRHPIDDEDRERAAYRAQALAKLAIPGD